jgi:hypothetical protein
VTTADSSNPSIAALDQLGPMGADLSAFFGDAPASPAALRPEVTPLVVRPLVLPPEACEYTPSIATRDATLAKNLESMPAQAIRTIRKIAQAKPREDITFIRSGDGSLSAVLREPSGNRQLASLHRPKAEAEALTRGVDLTAAGATVCMGFALGYHVEAISRRYGQMGVVLAFEPDVGLLRSVLEHVDHSAWLSQRNCVIITEPDDSGEITASITGAEGIFMVGTRMLEHPPSKARLGDKAERFGKSLAAAMRAVRTSIVTTLVHVDTTMRNLLGNIESYANAPGIDDLAGIAKGKPAIVVSAGPSLRRNIDLLSQPGVRDRVVIIAVQTVLKTLLAKGIRPHFVTALDHASISKRFGRRRGRHARRRTQGQPGDLRGLARRDPLSGGTHRRQHSVRQRRRRDPRRLQARPRRTAPGRDGGASRVLPRPSHGCRSRHSHRSGPGFHRRPVLRRRCGDPSSVVG